MEAANARVFLSDDDFSTSYAEIANSNTGSQCLTNVNNQRTLLSSISFDLATLPLRYSL